MSRTKSAPGPLSGPIEQTPWPAQLVGHVASPEPTPRIHGYDVEDDLARHYNHTERVLLTITGELPDAAAAGAAEVALAFLAPAPVSLAPAHTALVARLCGASSSALVGIAAVTLGEQARAEVQQQAELLDWLAGPRQPQLPACALATDEQQRASVRRIRRALQQRNVADALPRDADLNRSAALLALLFFCGLRSEEQLVTFEVIARLPCVMAEALCYAPRQFKDYPMDLPEFAYEETP